ncbi:hypothetical protein Hypma_011416 [Hypsizygus marmoreus]|uniref:Cytochrome b561 domain-containing protein n=1 Tax=Hypsizygus marmoreus TaxID=39966 RepID=A0A369JPN1_HYPMA|nr:hypothetical protein Hypma_011416 [Hypsizygus marmoreus]
MTPTTTDESPETNYELLPPAEPFEQLKTPMGREEQSLKPEARRGDLIAYYTALSAVAVLVTVTWIVVLHNNPTTVGWFALHPPLQTLSLSFFTYGILTLQPTSQPRTKAAGLTRHQIAIVLLGFPCILIGTMAVAYNKRIHNKEHMTTWHGTFGFLAFFWIFVQMALGGGSVWFQGVAFGGGVKAKALWKYHRLSGYFLFPTLLFTAHLGGGWSNWGAKYTDPGLQAITYTVAPFLILAAICVRVRLSKMNFFR